MKVKTYGTFLEMGEDIKAGHSHGRDYSVRAGNSKMEMDSDGDTDGSSLNERDDESDECKKIYDQGLIERRPL